MSNQDVVVRLSLENKQLSKQLADTERKYKRSMKNMEKDTQGFASTVAKSMRGLAIGTAAAAGIVAFKNALMSTVKHVDDLATAAEQLGVSFQSFQELRYAAEQAELPMEKLTSAFAKMQAKIGELGSSDGKKFAESLKAIGVSAQELAAANPEKQFRIIIDALKAIENPAKRAAAANEIFGRTFKDLNPLINIGSKGLDEYAKQAHSTGAVISDVTKNAMTDFDNKMNAINTQMKVALAEGFRPLVEHLNRLFVPGMANATGAANSFSNAIQTVGTLLSATLPMIERFNNGSLREKMQIANPMGGGIDYLASLPKAFKEAEKAQAEYARQQKALGKFDWSGFEPPPAPIFFPKEADVVKTGRAAGASAGKAVRQGFDDALRAEEARVSALSKLMDLQAEGDVVQEAVRAYAKGVQELVQLAKEAMLSMDDPRIVAVLQKLQDELSKVQQESADAWINEMINRANEASGQLQAVADRLREDDARNLEILGGHINGLFQAMASGSDAVKSVIKSMVAELISAIVYAKILMAMGKGGDTFGSTLGSILTGGMGGKSATAPTIRIQNFGGGAVQARQRSNGDLDVIINAISGRIASGGSPLDKALSVGYGLSRRGT